MSKPTRPLVGEVFGLRVAKEGPNSKLQRITKLPSLKTRTAKPRQSPPKITYESDLEQVWEVREDPLTPDDAKAHAFDLEERTARFGESIIRFVKKIPRDPANNRLIDQIVGCGTSVGANYCEANEGVSKKDFRNIIGRCVKEAKETKFFLRMLATAEPKLADEARNIYREAKELHLIFAAIYRNSK